MQTSWIYNKIVVIIRDLKDARFLNSFMDVVKNIFLRTDMLSLTVR